MRVIGELPYNLFLTGNLEANGLLAEMAVTEIIAEYGISIRQALRACHQAQRIARQIIFVELPNGFQGCVEFDDFMSVAARDEQMAVGQQERFVDVAGNG